ncbi:MAG: VOC family protein [Acholeplasmataceae bacterium]|nr:VOC family protein [Acholeplasmataceae bacterium]
MKNYHNKNVMYVSHVELLVSDIKKSLKLYQDILGFSILKEEDNKVYLTANQKDVLVTLVEQKGAIPAQYNVGLYHFALLLPKRSDLAKVIQSLIEHQYPVTGLSDHEISEAIYLEDPDNNGIEIAVDRDLNGKTMGQVGFVTKMLDYKDVLKQLDPLAPNKLSFDTVMGHVHFHVNDLTNAKEFFVNTLGYEVQMDFRDQASFISDQGYHHHIAYNLWNGPDAKKRAPNQAGLLNYTIKVPNRDYSTILSRFKKRNLILNEAQDYFMVKDVNDVDVRLERSE